MDNPSGFFKDTGIYKLTLRMTVLTVLMIAINWLTRGYIMPVYALVGILCALANQLGWSLVFFVMMPFFVILNPALVNNESSIYGFTVRSGPLLIGLILALRGASRQGRHRLPLSGIVPFLMIAIISSADGWAPSVSYMKLINFSVFLLGVWFGTQNLQHRPKDVLLLRSFFLALSCIATFGSVATIPFPTIGYAIGLRHVLSEEGVALAREVFYQRQADDLTTLFCGVTNHSQALAPLLALVVGWVMCDMLLLERRFRWLHMMIIITALPLAYLTRSRVGLVSLVAAFIVSGLYVTRKAELPPRLKAHLNMGVWVGMVLLIVGIFVIQARSGFLSGWIRKTSDVGADQRSLGEALTSSRTGLMEYSLYEFRRNPLFGSGFQVAIFTQDLVRENRGLILSAPIEKGVAPLMVLGETGIVGAACFLLFLVMFYAGCSRRRYVVTSSLFTVFLVTNMAEATIFSPGGMGGIFWMISVVGGFAIDTYLLYQKQLEQQWAAMGFQMAVPSIEMVEDRSGRRRMVEDARGVRRYGVKG